MSADSYSDLWPVFFDLFNFSSIIIAAGVFIAGYKFKVHPVILVIISALIGVIIL
jgi:hypothetical protein